MGGADGASAPTTIRKPRSPGGISTTIRRPGFPGGNSTTIRRPGPPGGNSAVVAILSRAGRRVGGRSRGGNACRPLPGDRRSQGGPRSNATSASTPFSFLTAKTKCTCLDGLCPLIGSQRVTDHAWVVRQKTFTATRTYIMRVDRCHDMPARTFTLVFHNINSQNNGETTRVIRRLVSLANARADTWCRIRFEQQGITRQTI